jgi:Rieske Fe-S protein
MAATASANAADDAQVRRYTRSLLVDIHGKPIRQGALAAETNYVYQYPFAATPCFLLRLPEAVTSESSLRKERGDTYASPSGVGPARNVVSFSAICAHKLAYPTRDVSFIRYQRTRSATSSGRVIHCCADHSVYDPMAGARVVAGPAPQPLAAIALEYDAARDEIAAIGTIGAEQFASFFEKYAFKLALEYGGLERAQRTVADTTIVRELTNYCRTTIEC